MINQGPYTHQASDTAYHFTCAVLKAGHEVFRIFFYHDGVNNATRMATPPQDDRHVIDRWSELASQHKLDLVVCVAAAQRRGILDEDEARSEEHTSELQSQAYLVCRLLLEQQNSALQNALSACP